MKRILIALALFAPACASEASTRADAAASASERTLPAADGVPIAYEIHGAGEPALVFVHGWSCDRAFWREQLDELARDHQVVALDLPGHGSSGADRASWTIAGLADDVRALVEGLDLQRVILIGHSMGGPVCLEAARLLPGRAIGVIGVDTLHDAEFEMPEGWAKSFADRLDADFEHAPGEFVRSMFPESADPALIDWTLARMKRADRKAVIALMRDFDNVDPKGLLSAAHVPVRAINAAATGGRTLPTAIETNRKYADFDAVTLERVGHFLMLESPDEFNPKLRAYVDELAASAPAAASPR